MESMRSPKKSVDIAPLRKKPYRDAGKMDDEGSLDKLNTVRGILEEKSRSPRLFL